MTICIIPARGGSKGIKNKNLKKFNGKPLIYYSINVAKKSKLFKRIIVTTDSNKIANIAKKYGAETPFIRNKKLSNDKTITYDVLKDCMKKLKINSDYFFCIYPTAPLIDVNDLKNAFRKLKKIKYDGLIATCEYSSSPYRALTVYKNNLKYVNSKYALSRSQDLKKMLFDTGSFCIFKTNKYIKSKGKLMRKMTNYNLNRYSSIDINTLEDFKFAEFLNKFKSLH